MKSIIYLSLSFLSITGLSADNPYTHQYRIQSNNNGYQAQSDYEARSLNNQERALQNQERMISQQNPHPGSRVPQGGTTRIGR